MTRHGALALAVASALLPAEPLAAETADQRFRLGNERHARSDLEGALGHWIEGVELALAEGKTNLAIKMLTNMGVVYRDQGETTRTITAWVRALKLLEGRGQWAREETLHENIGVAFMKMGRQEDYLRHAEQRLAIAESHGGNRLVARQFLADALLLNDRVDEAENTVLEGIAISDARGERHVRALLLNKLGIVYRKKKDLKKAIDYFSKAAQDLRELGDESEAVNVTINIGNACQDAGLFSLALENYRTALPFLRIQRRHETELSVLLNMSAAHIRIWEFEKALDLLRQVRASPALDAVPDRRQNLESKSGVAYASLGDLRSAESHFVRALELCRRGSAPLDLSAALSNLGALRVDMGRFADAIPLLEESLALRRAHGLPSGSEPEILLVAYLGAGQPEPARRTAFELGGPGAQALFHLKTGQFALALASYSADLERVRPLRSYEHIVADLIGSGRAEEGLGHPAAALRHYHEAFDLLEEMRLRRKPQERLRFFSGNDGGIPRLDAHEGLVRTAAEVRGLDESFFLSEAAKARQFSENATRRWHEKAIPVPKHLTERSDVLTEEFWQAASNADQAFHRRDTEGAARWENKKERVRRELNTHIEKIRIAAPEYAALAYPEQPLRPVQVRLGKDEALVEFEVTDIDTRGFLVSEGKVVRHWIIPWTRRELSRRVRDFLLPLRTVQTTADLSRFPAQQGFELYEALMKPALSGDGPPKDARLIIVPDEVLAALPFEALPSEDPKGVRMPSSRGGPAIVGMRFLADDRLISYAHSATSLMARRADGRSPGTSPRALVVADPIFGPSDSRSTSAGRTSGLGDMEEDESIIRSMGLAGTRTGPDAEKRVAPADSLEFPRLRRTGLLAENLRANAFSGLRTDVLTGSSATKAGLAHAALGEYRYIVLASHGILDGDIPEVMEPALLLSRPDGAPLRQGFLTMTEVLGFKLNADVTALTACRTGLGEEVSGEGPLGLGRAFQLAGSRNVLMSLWNVDEDSTTMLVEEFFKELSSGKAPTLALREARGSIRRAGYAHPFYWAPFVLYGN